LANRWCELLPISPALRQQLMVVDSPLLRLELVADLLGDLKGEALTPGD
jgi:Lon protease-like protein